MFIKLHLNLLSVCTRVRHVIPVEIRTQLAVIGSPLLHLGFRE